MAVAALRDGVLAEPHQRPTEQAGSERLIDEIVDAVGEVRTEATAAVGIGVPSVIDYATGSARSSVNVPLEDVPLRQILTDRLGVAVFVDNDATVAALAEAWDGERIAPRSLVMFTVGTGVGGGLVIGGKIFRGATGAAAEIGHMVVGLEISEGVPRASEFPQPGSLESLAAGGQLNALARAAAERSPKSALGKKLAETGDVSGKDAVEAAGDGDLEAAEVVAVLGRRLGIGIANAINIFDPEVVAIGGGVSAAGDLLLEPARETARAYSLPGVGTKTEIRLATVGPDAGVLGAALLAATEVAAGA